MARTCLPRSLRPGVVAARWAAGLAAILPAVAAAGPSRQGAVRELRVGLADGAPAARISAPAPFRIRAGELVIEAVEALVSPETGEGEPVLALGSFRTEERARQALDAFREGGEDAAGRLARHPETGRVLAVLGSAAAEAEAERLRGGGFPDAGVFDLPAASGEALVIRPLGASPIRIPGGVGLTVEPPSAGFLEWEGSPYRGAFSIVRSGDGVTVINRVDLEDYLLGVVPSELPPDLFPEKEALKAQALAARTYALRPRETYRERGYDLCSGPACQVYGGVAAEHPLSSAAVRETAGEGLYHEGRLIDALYTAACGGHTENAENVFSTPTPYLVARACVRDAGGTMVRSPAPADAPLDAAVVRAAGALPPEWSGPLLGEPAAPAEARRVVDSAVRRFGLRVCEAAPVAGDGDEVLPLGAFAELVEAVRCRPPSGPARGPAPDGAEFADAGAPALGRLLAEGLLDPSEAGLDPGRAVTRREVVGFAARLLGRDSRLFRRGQIRQADGAGIVIEPDGGAGTAGERLRLEPSAEARLFREIRPTRIPGRADPRPLAIPERSLRLRVGDFVRYATQRDSSAAAPAGSPGSRDGEPTVPIEVLILEDLGEAQDRFSRQSAWLVPKDNNGLSAAAARLRPIGSVVALEPLEYGRSGRVVRLRVVGTEGDLEVRGLRIRRLLGISENLFFAEPRRSGTGEILEWWFSGRGWGHGLGLCQAGAYGMAAAGADYREILAHYYPGTTVGASR